MAMTLTTTETTHSSVKRIKFEWTSSATGVVTGQTSAAYDGQVIALATDPGSTAPTDDYDVELLDSNGFDVLAKAGLNRDATATEYVTSGMGACSGERLSLSISNAGDSKQGTISVWIR